MPDAQKLDTNLQTYADHSVELMSPIKKESTDMKDEAEKLKITDAATLKAALDLRKKVVKHINTTDDYRKQYTRPLDEVTKQLISGQRDVLAPAEEAKTIVGEKIMDYEAEQERLAKIERDRVSTIIAGYTTQEAVNSRKIKVIDERGAELKAAYGSLCQEDQQNVEIKLAFTEAINRLLDTRDVLSRAQVDEAERAKQQAERDAEALKVRHEAETTPKATAAPQPKTGVKMVTKFAITDPGAVPREYCSVNESLIRQAIAAGVTEIVGVSIYKERSF